MAEETIYNWNPRSNNDGSLSQYVLNQYGTVNGTGSLYNNRILELGYRSKQEEIDAENKMNSSLKSINEKSKKEIDPDNILEKDIARSSYFTVNFNNNFEKVHFKVPGGAFNKSSFLPVKAITMNYGSVESFNIPIACYSDVPIVSKRRVGKITLTLYDLDDDSVERSFRYWISYMTKNGRTVYLSETAIPMTYRSYSVQGKLNSSSTFLVVPVGEIKVDRSYESNAEKTITINLAIVGTIN